ncbi:tyrosine-protein phosphatase [Actinomycetospora sp. TBRC 11914]|uniref:tyrosine-protein phosphatase n=1 Tax=Actinomycetospora sp. TBRC 11914 TaxID=2729387 RepID=UPI00145E7B5E|nr:tyrosine-protein phosphatase [Actinomycetospora sp. TBRC 11914]NMO89225.1 tyrosine-protein phosphatase [Actinomycetospora sp. TBRC 11914]
MKNPLRRLRRLRREAHLVRDLAAHVPPGPPWTNIRDVAGLPTIDGRRTRPGVLLRGDAPFADDGPGSPGWPEGLAWPPAIAIDLRSDRELDHPYPLPATSTNWIHLPLVDALAPDLLARGRDDRLAPGELYLGLLDAAHAWLPTMLDAVVDGPHPVLVHCAAGKDRTGVAIALLLRLAGVTRAAVDADFSRTNARRVGLQRRLERRGALRPGVVPAGDVGVRREQIVGVLDRLDGDGPERVAAAAGVADERVEQWRKVLVTQPD